MRNAYPTSLRIRWIGSRWPLAGSLCYLDHRIGSTTTGLKPADLPSAPSESGNRMPNQTLNKVHNWLRQTPVFSRWPGTASRRSDNEVDFVHGVVVAVSDRAVTVETKRHELVKLMGDGYPHVCDKCQVTVPGNVTYQRPPECREFCPYCGPEAPLRIMQVGEKVRVHHRFGAGNGPHSLIQTNQIWGQWYGEKWEW